MVDTGVSGVWQLKVSDSFSAAHALRHYEGKCENLHGHNFWVEICVEGRALEQKTEMLLDFRILKNILKKALAGLEHKHLNETPPFDDANPTSENLARHIFLLCAKELAQYTSVSLKSVTVCEKPGQGATYFE